MNENKVYPLFFAMPIIIIYTLGFVLPMISGVVLSFTNWGLLNPEIRFIGLENYKEIFLYDNSMIKAIINNVWFAVVTTIFMNIIGLCLALLFNEGLKTKNILRTIFYFPVTLSPLVIGLVFTSLLHPTTGFVNEILNVIGLENLTTAWLSNPKTAMNSVMGVEIWRTAGFCMVIYLAGLQLIPKELIEASLIDGASGPRRLIHVILPLLVPSFTVNIVLNFVAELKVFDIIFVLTGGGPGRLTHVVNTVVFDEFGSGRYGVANALQTIVLVITSVFAYYLLKYFTSKEVDT